MAGEADIVVTFWGEPVRRTAKPSIHQCGSLADARAARAAGASGVVAGTRFLLSEESAAVGSARALASAPARCCPLCAGETGARLRDILAGRRARPQLAG